MKHMHKLLSVIIVLALAMSLAAPAFASGENVIIENAEEGKTYGVWQILQWMNGKYYVTDTWYAVLSNIVAFEHDLYEGEDRWYAPNPTDIQTDAAMQAIADNIDDVSACEMATATSDTVKMEVSGREGCFYINAAGGAFFNNILDNEIILSDGEGKITINGGAPRKAYNIYKLFELESFNGEAYSYKPTTNWVDFLNTDEAQKYVELENGYVTWVNSDKADDGEAVKAFAAAALAYADANDVEPDATEETNSNGTVEFTKLPLGYYLVESPVGTLLALNTTDKEVTITEKNDDPTVEKLVQEDNGAWIEANDAKIGDTVNFKTTIHAKPGAQNYVLHDEMSEGLTFNEHSVVIAGLEKDTHYTVEVLSDSDTCDKGHACDFHITFKQTYLDTITANTDIVVTYSAVLNEKAAVYTGASGEFNTNATVLYYGENTDISTNPAATTTTTYEFDLVKTDSDSKLLTGAKFKLYDAEENGNEIPVFEVSDGVYRVAYTAEEIAKAKEISAGKVIIQGFNGASSYWLEETEAPEGYNKIASRSEVAFIADNLKATISAADIYQEGGVRVINNTGTLFPSTGGIGTTIFYIVGGLMAVGAAVLLVTKRRMTVGE